MRLCPYVVRFPYFMSGDYHVYCNGEWMSALDHYMVFMSER